MSMNITQQEDKKKKKKVCKTRTAWVAHSDDQEKKKEFVISWKTANSPYLVSVLLPVS